MLRGQVAKAIHEDRLRVADERRRARRAYDVPDRVKTDRSLSALVRTLRRLRTEGRLPTQTHEAATTETEVARK